MLKQLFDTHIDTQVAMGKLEDDRNLHDLRVADAVSSSLLTILPAFPPAAVPATVLNVGKAATMPFLYEGVTGDSQAAANRSASVAQVDQWYSATLEHDGDEHAGRRRVRRHAGRRRELDVRARGRRGRPVHRRQRAACSTRAA